MKKIILSFLMICYTTLLFAQAPKDHLRRDFKTYIEFTQSNDFKQAMEYVVDDFFKVVPKAQMIKQFEQVFNDPGLEIKLENPKVLKVGSLEKIDKKHYAIITHSNLLKVRVRPKDDSETEEDLKQKAALLKASFAKQAGVQDIQYDEKKHAFKVKVVEKICGVSDDNGAHWKFVKLDKDILFILEQFLPKAILEQI